MFLELAVRLYNMVNVLNAMKLYTLKWLLSCHVNFASLRVNSHSLRKGRHRAGPQEWPEAGVPRPLGGFPLAFGVSVSCVLLMEEMWQQIIPGCTRLPRFSVFMTAFPYWPSADQLPTPGSFKCSRDRVKKSLQGMGETDRAGNGSRRSTLGHAQIRFPRENRKDLTKVLLANLIQSSKQMPPF